MDKYKTHLKKIVEHGQLQINKKANNYGLMNELLFLSPEDVDEILLGHKVARRLLYDELKLYIEGINEVSEYKKKGIHWWDYCAPTMINTYPRYFRRLPKLIDKINKEKRGSKNYMLFIGETGTTTSQLPCLSLMQFQISLGGLYITVYQRSADASLGLPSDIYQVRMIAEMIDVPLKEIVWHIGNSHIYSNNIELTKEYLKTGVQPKFNLNV